MLINKVGNKRKRGKSASGANVAGRTSKTPVPGWPGYRVRYGGTWNPSACSKFAAEINHT